MQRAPKRGRVNDTQAQPNPEGTKAAKVTQRSPEVLNGSALQPKHSTTSALGAMAEMSPVPAEMLAMTQRAVLGPASFPSGSSDLTGLDPLMTAGLRLHITLVLGEERSLGTEPQGHAPKGVTAGFDYTSVPTVLM